jgi:hypothetical protein
MSNRRPSLAKTKPLPTSTGGIETLPEGKRIAWGVILSQAARLTPDLTPEERLIIRREMEAELHTYKPERESTTTLSE